MRIIALALSLAACASVPSETPAQLVAGCWVDRTPTHASFMRWNASEGQALQGELREYGLTGDARRTRFSLSPDTSGWQLCELGANGQACWAVAQAEAGSLEGGRAFIDRHRDRLRVGVVGADGRDRLIFDGLGEGCG